MLFMSCLACYVKNLVICEYIISWDLNREKQPSEVFYKKLFLKISQYSQENTCVGVSF